MRRITLAGLLKIELPGHTVLLCDGGTLAWGGDTYRSRDSLFGVPMPPDSIQDGVGEEAPNMQMRFLPDPGASAAALTAKANQGARVRLWTAEVDEDSGLITGTPEIEFDGLIDVPRLRWPKSGRVLEVDVISVWEKLFNVEEGTVLNGPAHKRIYPDELGMDNTTGVEGQVAWGTGSVATGS